MATVVANVQTIVNSTLIMPAAVAVHVEPQSGLRAVMPGQSVAFYDPENAVCLGGGTIADADPPGCLQGPGRRRV